MPFLLAARFINPCMKDGWGLAWKRAMIIGTGQPGNWAMARRYLGRR